VPIGRAGRVRSSADKVCVDDLKQADRGRRRAVGGAANHDLVAVEVLTIDLDSHGVASVKFECRAFTHTTDSVVLSGPSALRGSGRLRASLARCQPSRRRLLVGEAKTDAGVREVELLGVLRDELDTYKLRSRVAAQEDLVFTTATGATRDRTNARQRVIVPVVERAEGLLAHRGQPPLPAGATAHKLRHTFASVLVMLGEDAAHVMAQLGHTDPAFTLRIYTHAMRRDEAAKQRLKALVEGRDWAPMGTSTANDPLRGPSRTCPRRRRKTPQLPGLRTMGAAGFEPATSRV
jgi:hypothetical protein